MDISYDNLRLTLIINLSVSMRLLIGLILAIVVFSAPYNQNLAIIQAKLAVITHCSTQQIESWSCKICKDYPYLKNVTQIENSNTKISGFVGYDHNKNSIVISWRGTTVAQNWIEDADFRLMDYKLDSRCTGCKIHTGFFNAYISVSTRVLDKVTSLLNAYPTATITITGHSLGGALAQVTALLLNKNYGTKIKQMYVYGCPRLGNSNLAHFLHSLIPQIYRVVHYKDIVPHLPPHDLEYLHPAYEVFYDQQMKLIKICNQSGEDTSCSNSLAPGYSLNDHTLYWVKTDSSVC